MKLHFEPNLDFQLEAIEAVCDLFRGQEICRTEFTVTSRSVGAIQLPGMEDDLSELGIGNRLSLLDEELLANLNDVQLRNGLAPSSGLTSGDFTVEMETGTGKTYVYLRTIFELNRRYGFTKFVIVVPSVAIKEGVYKSLQMMAEHLRTLYAGVPFEYFLYDSSKLGQVRSFATDSQIRVMVVTVGAINKKDVNNLYKESEKTGGERPIDLIRTTRPVVIVDEPQSVDGGLTGAGKNALDAMTPLCTLRYSATHADKHHMVYRLDAVDAYERRLVKQIEVASATVEQAHNRPYVRILSVEGKRLLISARVELDVQAASGVRRKEMTVHDGDDLQQTTGRELYRNCRIGEIRVAKGSEFVELRTPGGEHFLKPGQAFGDVEERSVHREMIRRTIKEHLDKEKRLRPLGIKVLTLFFIDQVSRYRRYDGKRPIKGEYAEIFEQEYLRLAQHPDYHTLFGEVDLSRSSEEVHNGYFSIDKSGDWAETSESNQTGRDSAERAYNLIMKEKEKLLSFETPLKFIFSHSALREGWDNPNVFQICSLRDIRSERERRQTIGRGLRLCVNQNGERLHGSDVNTLTVIANESYEQFAENLQREIEQDTGIRFGIVEKHQFAAVRTTDAEGAQKALGMEQSLALWSHLKAQGYLDATGRVLDPLRSALKDGTLNLPPAFEGEFSQIEQILKRAAGKLEVKNADEKRLIRTRQAVLNSPEFTALWDRIKHKTTYRVNFDNERLLQDCMRALRDAPAIQRTRLVWRKADVAIGKSGIEATEREGSDVRNLNEGDIELPDILTELQNRTQLTRRSIVRILTDPTTRHRLEEFKRNPQAYIELAGEVIRRCMRLAIVEGIKYQRIGEEHYYAQELFKAEELNGYLKQMLTDTKKSVYEAVRYDSETERSFANDLEQNQAVRVYAKLPNWFEVSTPLGKYNPDWAILVETDGEERLYLVVETKSTLFTDELRDAEVGKIQCGRAHFEALAVGDSPAKYHVARSVEELISSVT